MSKINIFEDTMIDIAVKMSDGNPGAIQALAELIKNNKRIDPESSLGELGTIIYLDENKIYGSDIYILFNDKCDRNVRKMILLLRACQLGFFSNKRLKMLSLDQMRKFDISKEEWIELEDKVCEFLPEFEKNNETD